MEPLQADDPEWVGRYRLTARLGVGGMGRVYVGVTPEGQQAAVKVIRDDLAGDTAFRQRFRREVSAAVAVTGLFTARVLDADPDAVPPWLATQYVEGPSLKEAVQRSGPLSEPSLFALARGLAEALAAIHAAGLAHRDLKPANVLLSPAGPKVIDFGIARTADSTQLTGTGQLIGTPEFMAPEQVAGADTGPAADVFALGSTLTYAATGLSPFATDHTAATLIRILQGEPDLRGLPVGATNLIRSCLAKDPARRPTATQLAVQLRGDPPPGPGPGPTVRLDTPRAPAGSRRGLVVAAAVVAAALVAGGTAIVLGNGTDPPPPLTTATGSRIDPNGPQARYVDRLCASGNLLVSLAQSATAPQPTGDPAIARRDFLAATGRTISVVDAALADYATLRDDAPNPDVGTRFGLVVDEFITARAAFVEAQNHVEASDPLTTGAYSAAVDRFTNGVRSLSLAAQLVQDIELPDEYTDASAAAPSCAR